MAKNKAPSLRVIDEILFNMIDLQRFAVHEQEQLVKIWNKALEQIVGRLAGDDLTSWNRQRMSAFLRDSAAIFEANIDQIDRESVKASIELCQAQLEHVPGMLNEAFGGVEIFQRVMLTEERIRSILNTGLRNRGMTNLTGKLKTNARKRFDRFIVQTFEQSAAMQLQGFTLDQIVRGLKDVSGPLNISKRESFLISHARIMAAGNEAYNAIYQANEDVLSGLQWCAWIDGRQCAICYGVNGKVYNLDYSPQGNSPALPNGAGPQAHWNCRCVMFPVTKSYDELASKQGPSGQPGPLTKRARGQLAGLPEEAKKAFDEPPSIPDSPQDYIEWLDTLTEAEQLEVLGAARHRLFKKGILKARSDLVHQQRRGLSLEELKKKWKKGKEMRP